MRINQAYISKSVADFPFLESLELTPYVDSSAPCLFIGCYTQEDLDAILKHKGKVVVLWCGQDAITAIFMGWAAQLKHYQHVTWLVNVERVLRNFLEVELVSPILLGGNFRASVLRACSPPSIRQGKIYAYCPDSFKEYHRIDIIRELQEYYFDSFDFVIGGGGVDQSTWLKRLGDIVYDDCFIGLCLSGFAGGGQTVLQMGLKGRVVVTNVIDAPNVCNWNDVADIKKVIEQQAKNIGKENFSLASTMKSVCSKKPIWL